MLVSTPSLESAATVLGRDFLARGCHRLMCGFRRTFLPKQSAVEAPREGKRCRIVDRPRGANKIRNAAGEERFGEARRKQSISRRSAVGGDARFAGVRENEPRHAVDAAKLMGGENILRVSVEEPARPGRIRCVEKAVAAVMQDIETMIDQLIEHSHAGGFSRAEKPDDFDFGRSAELLEDRRHGVALLLRARKRSVGRRVRNHKHAESAAAKDRRLGQRGEASAQLPRQPACGAQKTIEIKALSPETPARARSFPNECEPSLRRP